MIRDADPSDAPALAAILTDWTSATPWLPDLHSPAEDLGFVGGLIGEGLVRGALVGDAAAGFLARRNDDVLQLQVSAKSRGRGLGADLLNDAKLGADRLALWCFAENTDALRFYARHGFSEIAATDGSGNEERLPDVQLEWRAG